MRKIPLHFRILSGMAVGVVFAFIIIQFDWGTQFTKDWIKPFGTIFINSLKLIAIPLILASLVKGVSDLKDISKLSTLGVRALSIIIATTVFSVCLGLFLVNVIKPGSAIQEETRVTMLSEYADEAVKRQEAAAEQKQAGPLQFVEDIVPDNIFKALSNNTLMLQVIFFAILLGISIVLLPEDKTRVFKTFFDNLNAIILRMIDILMLGAPFGVFALMASLVAESPQIEIFIALGKYAMTVLIGLLFLAFIFYPGLVAIFARRNPIKFLRQISPAQLLALSTSSSAATMPVTMEVIEKKVGVDQEIVSFVVPIGTTINMDGTALYQAVAAVFIAQVYGMDLSFATQLGIVFTATLASIGAAAVPGAGMVVLVIVLAQAGIPEAGLALIFAVDRPLDMVRTVVNVTSDCSISTMIAKSMGKLRTPEPGPYID